MLDESASGTGSCSRWPTRRTVAKFGNDRLLSEIMSEMIVCGKRIVQGPDDIVSRAMWEI